MHLSVHLAGFNVPTLCSITIVHSYLVEHRAVLCIEHHASPRCKTDTLFLLSAGFIQFRQPGQISVYRLLSPMQMGLPVNITYAGHVQQNLPNVRQRPSVIFN